MSRLLENVPAKVSPDMRRADLLLMLRSEMLSFDTS